MINATTYGVNILNALFNTSKKTSSNTVTFATTPYMGLLTKMPGTDGTGYEEPTSDDYQRILVTNVGSYGKQMFGAAVAEEGIGIFEGKKIAKLTNQDLLVWPFSKTDAYGEIKGIALFDSLDATKASYWQLLGHWDDETGEFVAEPMTIAAGGIPVVATGDCEVIFV